MSRFKDFTDEERALIAMSLTTTMMMEVTKAREEGVRPSATIALAVISLTDEIAASFEPPLEMVSPELRAKVQLLAEREAEEDD